MQIGGDRSLVLPRGASGDLGAVVWGLKALLRLGDLVLSSGVTGAVNWSLDQGLAWWSGSGGGGGGSARPREVERGVNGESQREGRTGRGPCS